MKSVLGDFNEISLHGIARHLASSLQIYILHLLHNEFKCLNHVYIIILPVKSATNCADSLPSNNYIFLDITSCINTLFMQLMTHQHNCKTQLDPEHEGRSVTYNAYMHMQLWRSPMDRTPPWSEDL